VDDHYLTVDDCFALNSQRTGNLGEPLGPIQPRAGKDLLPTPVEMDLNAVAVVLDFMKPLAARRGLGLQGGKLGPNEPRHLNTL
jgi:hypothetical protein